MAAGGGPGCSPSFNPTTCSRTGSAVQAKGTDKGKVEGLVGYVRRNFLVPIPSFESFDALNAHLEQHCVRRFDDRLRGHNETIGERLERDLEALRPLPAVPYDASDKHATRVSSLSAGQVPDQRLLGASGLWTSGRAGSRICARGCDQLWL